MFYIPKKKRVYDMYIRNFYRVQFTSSLNEVYVHVHVYESGVNRKSRI